MNTIIPIIFISLLLAFFIYGVIFAKKNNEKLEEYLSHEKLVAQFNNLKIRDSESMKMNFWTGDLKVFENTLVISNGAYFHHIILNENIRKIKKRPMTIDLKKIELNKDKLIINGIKHRVLGSSNIKIRIQSNLKNEILDINTLLSNLLSK